MKNTIRDQINSVYTKKENGNFEKRIIETK